MGQSLHGILLGIDPPEGIELDSHNDDPRWPRGMLLAFQECCGGLIKAHAEKHKLEIWESIDRFIPVTTNGDAPKVGFLLALGTEGGYGAPPLATLPLHPVDLMAVPRYARASKRVWRRWRRFTKWAKSKGVVLPNARWWIVTMEVG
jgi:hypothetical protein